MKQQLFASVDKYISDLLAEEDDALKAVDQSIYDQGIPQISVSPNQGKFLQIMATLCGARNMLEIGTLAGYSTIWMARALPEGGRMVTLEYDALHARVARENIERAGLAEKVEVRLGKAIDILPQLEQEGAGPFDMIFIDADKPPYPEYYEWALKLSRPGTLIIADNVIREGQVLDPNSPDEKVQGVQRLNEILSRDSRVSATILQTVGIKEYDGMAIAVVK
ncbi:MAG TPA: O-methyltransferase [Saprospiraceae bacterium]|mgnify:CR=1 FL=1|nr:O-methyltransferase [Saprospiraceae bacterium]HPI06960.1 O-methyltransferase [Saprospiraceae bacterium]